MKRDPPPFTYRPGGHLDVKDDTVHDPCFQRHKPAEPAGCGDCGAVFHTDRWQWLVMPAGVHQMRCPACRRIHDDMPAAWVTMDGEFAQAHADELLDLARNLEAREKAAHPLQRIIAIERRIEGGADHHRPEPGARHRRCLPARLQERTGHPLQSRRISAAG